MSVDCGILRIIFQILGLLELHSTILVICNFNPKLYNMNYKTRLYFRTLSDIQCVFTSRNENVSYRICYYHTDSKDLTISPNNGFSELLDSSVAFKGKLKPNCGLVVIGICIFTRNLFLIHKEVLKI